MSAILSLSYILCLSDAAATLELDQSVTHTLNIIKPKFRTGTADGNFVYLRMKSKGR